MQLVGVSSVAKLTEIGCRNAKPGDKDRKLFDERGLYLLIKTRGSKLWRLKFRLDGRERLLSLGSYPDASLAEAREARDAKRKLIAKGIDPVAKKRAEAAEKADEQRRLLADVAERYYRKKQAAWSTTHRRDVRRIIDKELVPALGMMPMAAIRTADVRRMLDQIQARGALTFVRDVRIYFRAIWNFHNSEREHDRQLADPSLRVVLDDAPAEQAHASLEPPEIGPFLRKLAFADATPLVRIAVRLLLLTATRTNELRRARWSEIDTQEKLWRLAPGRTKANRAHLVPLSPQALALLAQLRTLSGGHNLLFPSLIDPDEPISDGTILACIYRLGYRGRLTSHGMRSMFSRWAHEARSPDGGVLYPSDAIERQLGHARADKVKNAYLHSEFLKDRVRMLTAWAAYLDAAEHDASAAVVPLRAVAAAS